jgi:ribosomal protein S10
MQQRLYLDSCNRSSFLECLIYLTDIFGLKPIILPKKIKKLTLLKSPNGNKKHRQQIEMRKWKAFFTLKKSKLPEANLAQFPDVNISFN